MPVSILIHAQFLSTLSLRRATLISMLNSPHSKDFYPRSPCGERPVKFKLDFINQEFLSTLSLRRATFNFLDLSRAHKNFYPRSPCGERRPLKWFGQACTSFLSTLSLRRATLGALWVLLTQIFLSTLSLRRATQTKTLKVASLCISIHALLAESDP